MNRANNINLLLSKYYYDIKQPTSFQSSSKLHKLIKSDINDIKQNEINNWLLKQKTYGVHQTFYKYFKRYDNNINILKINCKKQLTILHIKVIKPSLKQIKQLLQRKRNLK